MIHRFRVQNFKSIRDVEVQLSPVTVFVGKSGTGKSNLVESIRFLRDVLESYKAVNKWNEIRPATNPNSQTSFDVEFSIAGIKENFAYNLVLGFTHGRVYPIEEKLVLGKRKLFHHKLENERQLKSAWLTEPNLVHPPEPGVLVLGKIPSISEVVIAFTALTSGIGCYVFSDNVLCGGKSNKSAIGLDDAALNYLDTLKEIVSNLQDLNVRKSIVGALQRVNPSVSAVELNNLQDPSHVIVGHTFGPVNLFVSASMKVTNW